MVQVRTSDGVVEGEKVENRYGRPFYSFKGIPYAEPPIGDLRFKAPVQIKPWTGVRQAKQFGPCCPQYHLFTKTHVSGSEDCLYLNVYTPDISPKKPLPVMFWIHGGAFLCGSSDEYDPDFLIRSDVILVTINYRLGALGFLTLDTEDIPGNAGMKDQVEAMKWVQRNISSFGGDPNNVTIFGESAGAASVSYHLISPMTKGLFQKAIVQSGSCFNPWAIDTVPRTRAIALAKKLGLNSDDDKEISKFLKSQPVESFVNVNIPLSYMESKKFHLQFTIVDENDFGSDRYFYGDAYKLVSSGIHEGVQVINGYMEHEGTMMVTELQDPNEVLKNANLFSEFFVPTNILMKCTIPQALEIGNKIGNFYFNREKVSMNSVLGVINFYTMEMFVYGVLLWQNLCAYTKRNKIYLYKFTCKSERKSFIATNKVLGQTRYTSHSDDLAYLFPMRIFCEEVDTSSKSFEMINEVTKLWTNFAKFGDPTAGDAQGTKWLPYTLNNKHYMDIGEKLILKKSPEEKEFKFWTEIYKDFYPLEHALRDLNINSN